MTPIGKYILKLRATYPKKVQNLTLITLLMVARKTFFNVSREVGDYSVSIDSTISIALVSIALSLYVINTNRRTFVNVFHKTESFAAYYFIAMLSFLWAGSANTIMFKSMEVLCGYFVMCLTLYNIKSQRQALYYIILLSTIITYMDVVNHIWKAGITLEAFHTNGYTMSAMIGFICSLGAINVKIFTIRELKYFLILDGIAVLLGTSTATFISAIVGMLIIFTSGKRKVHVIFTFLMCIVVYSIYNLTRDFINEILFYGKNKAAVESGSGRQFIWESCIAKWRTSPWFGTGFLIGERDISSFGTHVVRAISAHNSFLSVLVGTGVVGMLVFTRFLYLWFVNMYRNIRYNRYATVLFSASVAVMVNCNSFPAIGSDWNYVAPCVFALIAFVFINLKHWED